MIIQSETNNDSSSQLSDHQTIPESDAHGTLTTAPSTNLIDDADSTMSKVDESLETRDSYANVSGGATETSNVTININPSNASEEHVSSLTTNEVTIESGLVNFTFEISDSINHQYYFRTIITTMSILMEVLFKVYQIIIHLQVSLTSISNCHHVDL